MCKENGIMVAVSLDGSRDVNDSMRIDNDRLGTYGKVTSSINKLVAAGVKVFGSVTVGPHNINLLSETSDLLEKLNIKKFGFNFIKGKQLIELVGIDGVEEYCRQSAKAVMEYSKTHKRGFEYQLEKKLDAFERKDFFPHDCTCYGSQLVIQPDGQISNCPFFKTGFGHVNEVNDNFRIWNQPLVKEWRKRLPLYHQEFKNNDAKAMCGAGCAWSSKELYGDFLSVDQSSRIFSEEVFNELIWSKQ
jgi:radical SAM protein with 4Fe4S-binding SPASM domain